MYSKILVPVDGSEHSALGLEEAVKLARALGAHIHLIHVIKRLAAESIGEYP